MMIEPEGSVGVQGGAEGIVNYFTAPESARRYATGRPSGHARVLEVLQRELASHLPVERALDVGCGTGHSTVALLPYARAIVGVDSSSEMLAQVPRAPRIEYRKGYAEDLPCRTEDFELVTVSSAYHWFDHDRFLTEAARVLRPAGWLVLYKAGSMGRLPSRSDFESWRREVLNLRYPKVARNDEPLTTAQAERFGFTEVMMEALPYAQQYTRESYVENLMTHSRVIRVVDGGHEPPGAARAWLRAELARFFPPEGIELIHEARIHVLRRHARA
jgi:ubiquinone/menaquinone biosynthesis C-methylase UbiE